LGEAFAGEATLVLLDDVWPPGDVARDVMNALHEQVSVVVTTRGVTVPGAAPVHVDELTTIEARLLLLGPDAESASTEVVKRPGFGRGSVY
jgi:hypothetical protein